MCTIFPATKVGVSIPIPTFPELFKVIWGVEPEPAINCNCDVLPPEISLPTLAVIVFEESWKNICDLLFELELVLKTLPLSSVTVVNWPEVTVPAKVEPVLVIVNSVLPEGFI